MGGLATLRALIKNRPSAKLLQFCIATLLNLSGYKKSHSAMVFGDIIPPPKPSVGDAPAGGQGDGVGAGASAGAGVGAGAGADAGAAAGAGATDAKQSQPQPEKRTESIVSVLKPLLWGRRIASMPFLIASVLCRLSYYKPGRVRMVEDGVVDMIAELQREQVRRTMPLCARPVLQR